MTNQPTESIVLDIKDGYAVITLIRPEKHNALDRAAMRGIWKALEDAGAAGARAIIFTGAGDVSFCAGADLKDTTSETSTAAAPTTWMATQQRITAHPAVIIAAVNGFALGGGITLVNNSDIAVASTTATFGIPEINYGIYGSLAGPSTVQRIAQKHVAKMVFTGERISAAEAQRIGLVNEVVEPDAVLARAEELAQKIAAFDPLALSVAKAAIRAEQHMEWNDALLHGSWSTAFIGSARRTASPA
jgi:enoyl-CoA hydratase/carnithine racemase